MNPFLQFWADLLVRPKNFYQKHIPNGIYQPDYFYLVFFLWGLGSGIDRLDTQFVKYDLQGNYERIESLNSWPLYWTIAAFAGVLGTILKYYIAGWFYNLRIKWARGKGDIQFARYSNMYSSVVLDLAIILIALITMFISPTPYDPYSELSAWDIISSLLVLGALYRSVYTSYAGVITCTQPDLILARLWFLALPIIFYTILYIAIIILIWKVLTGSFG